MQALFEYMDGGDLRSYLDKTPATPWEITKLSIAVSIAEALVYVHSIEPTPVVHRDLKSRNVLLTTPPIRAKLSDFGVARHLSRNHSMTTGVGTSLWLAPEVITGGGNYTTACDIYSFGVALTELDTHRLPFSYLGGVRGELPKIAILGKVAVDGLQPTLSDSCPTPIAQLAQRCLSFAPDQRPTAQDVLSTLVLFRENSRWPDEIGVLK